MATGFPTVYQGQPTRAVPGDYIMDRATVIAWDKENFSLGLKYGTFVWYDPVGKILTNVYNATYYQAGWLVRDVTSVVNNNIGGDFLSIEESIATNRLTNIANVLNQGLIMVKAKDGDTPPAKFEPVLIDATTGEATSDPSGIPMYAKFIKEFEKNVWYIQQMLVL